MPGAAAGAADDAHRPPIRAPHIQAGSAVSEEPITDLYHNPTKSIVAEAMSQYWTVRVGVDSDGYAAQVSLTDAARNWDAEQLSEAILKVAAVAHDRYVALTDPAETTSLILKQIAAAERDLDF